MNKNNSTYPQISKEATEAIERLRKHIDSLPEERRPKVCISSIAYNQEAFIAQTLEGFVMQQTDFPFVAVVHDDASTDGTADIIRKYAEKYPDIIFPIFESENQYYKPGGPLTLIMHYAEEATKAPYIAKCEGDDYWTSPDKLQRQADILDNHPEYSICSHACTYLYQKDGHTWRENTDPSGEYDLSTLINDKWIFQTLTVMYRQLPEIFDLYNRYPCKRDASLIYAILRNGKGYFIGEDFGMYRVHPGGVWSKVNETQRWLSEFNVRKGIYEVEQSREAAHYLSGCLGISTVGRRDLFKLRSEVLYIFHVMRKHEGFGKAFKKLYSRFF